MTAPLQQLLLMGVPPAGVNNKATDGSATGTFSGTTTGTCSLTTTQANDVIVVMVHCEKVGSAQTVSSVTSPHVTFAKRASLAFLNANNNSNQNLEIWWGLASSALSAETITVTLNATTDDASIVAFGVSGCNNPSSPWDTNGSVPATGFNNSGTTNTVTVSGVSTNSNIPMMLSMYGSSQVGGVSTITGFTTIATAQNNGGALFSLTRASFENFSNAQSSASFTYSTNPVFGGIIDALV